jgi:DNA-binding NarL/FixJ family response regulator
MRVRDIDKITPSEWRIYNLIVNEGLTDLELATRLHRTKRGTTEQVKRLRKKLKFSSKLKMVVAYWKAKVC